ncbi:Fur family transcriptional regulator [Sulfurospirillum sp. 1612]|uniref:Fur family transcriptional regulator n=1 Tax=Sulfurospirillum sp. 1612 TaxID=3094835 RepID=UPI002F948CFA
MTINQIIKNSNLKLTSARIEILEILLTKNKPISYEDIKNSLTMDKATFYRNIAKFEENAIIRSFEANDKKRYFSLEQNFHPHFICTKCHTISCLNETQIVEMDDYKIESIVIKGICPKCLQS